MRFNPLANIIRLSNVHLPMFSQNHEVNSTSFFPVREPFHSTNTGKTLNRLCHVVFKFFCIELRKICHVQVKILQGPRAHLLGNFWSVRSPPFIFEYRVHELAVFLVPFAEGGDQDFAQRFVVFPRFVQVFVPSKFESILCRSDKFAEVCSQSLVCHLFLFLVENDKPVSSRVLVYDCLVRKLAIKPFCMAKVCLYLVLISRDRSSRHSPLRVIQTSSGFRTGTNHP